MSKIFISYRREDTSGHAGRIYEALVKAVGPEQVFQDVGLDPGINFETKIVQALEGCSVVLLVIGQRFLAGDAKGVRRIDNPTDHLRKEIVLALARDGVLLIPVLVDNARMPARDELPEDIKDLHTRQAIELSNTPPRWRADLELLIAAVSRAIGHRQVPQPYEILPAHPQSEHGRGGLMADWRVRWAALLIVCYALPIAVFSQSGKVEGALNRVIYFLVFGGLWGWATWFSFGPRCLLPPGLGILSTVGSWAYGWALVAPRALAGLRQETTAAFCEPIAMRLQSVLELQPGESTARVVPVR